MFFDHVRAVRGRGANRGVAFSVAPYWSREPLAKIPSSLRRVRRVRVQSARRHIWRWPLPVGRMYCNSREKEIQSCRLCLTPAMATLPRNDFFDLFTLAFPPYFSEDSMKVHSAYPLRSGFAGVHLERVG